MSVNTLTGLVVGLMATALFLFYVYLYSPPPPEPQEPEPERKATIMMPRAPEVPVKLETTTEPEPKSAPKTEPKKAPAAPERGQEGGSKNPKPRKDTKSEISKTKGNTEKSPPKAAPKPVPKPKDVSKSGLLGVFGQNGMQSEVNRAKNSSQGATNNAANATGTAPDGTDDGGGNALHQVNASGNGTATYGIKGVETAGKGSGRTGYGQSGIGAKKNASLIARRRTFDHLERNDRQRGHSPCRSSEPQTNQSLLRKRFEPRTGFVRKNRHSVDDRPRRSRFRSRNQKYDDEFGRCRKLFSGTFKNMEIS